jgi:hypothetical protein
MLMQFKEKQVPDINSEFLNFQTGNAGMSILEFKSDLS